jgi:agmatinase
MHSESALLALGWATLAAAHAGHGQSQTVIAGPHKSLWYNKLPGDGGTQAGLSSIPLFIAGH